MPDLTSGAGWGPSTGHRTVLVQSSRSLALATPQEEAGSRPSRRAWLTPSPTPGTASKVVILMQIVASIVVINSINNSTDKSY